MQVCNLMVEKAPFGVCDDCTLRQYSVNEMNIYKIKATHPLELKLKKN